MMQLSQNQTKRLTAVHGWGGVVLGLLLYVVVATGTVAVFGQEIAKWSAGASSSRGIDHPIDAIIRDLATKLPRFYLAETSIWENEAGELVAFFHSHVPKPETGENADFGTLFRVDPVSAVVLDRHEGFIWERPDTWETSALRHFLVELHVRLHLPDPWGLLATGILALLLMATALSGLLMHRHLIRDLFVAERSRARLVSARDRHLLASSWSLPFAVVLAFTGSFFSFASTVSLPILAQVAFGGDREAMMETLYEPAAPADDRPAVAADLDSILTRSTEATGGPPVFVSIHGFGRADARVSVWHAAGGGRMGFAHAVFDGADGRFLGVRPGIGTSRSLGSDLNDLMWPLHVGDFAGLASKCLWGALGTTICFVTMSGLRLWIRRRENDPAWRRFGRAVTTVGYGLPVALVGSACAAFLSATAGDPFFWTPVGFSVAALAGIALGAAVPENDRLALAFRRTLAWSCLLLPIVRMAGGGRSWAEALANGDAEVIAIDLLALATGGTLRLLVRRSPTRRDTAAQLPEPAE